MLKKKIRKKYVEIFFFFSIFEETKIGKKFLKKKYYKKILVKKIKRNDTGKWDTRERDLRARTSADASGISG